MSTEPFTQGDVVAGLEPDEHVELSKVTPLGAKILVEGVGVTSRRVIRRPLSADELARLTRVRGASFSYDGEAKSFLLAPERDKLKQLGDRAYLYIVTCCAGERASAQGDGIRSMPATLPRLRIIQDPMAQLHPAMLYRQVQYFVTEADRRRHGHDHDCPAPD